MSGTAFATETPQTVASRTAAGARRLEIGPRDLPLEGFEHLDIYSGPHIEHVADASEPLPFDDDTFVEIFASHIIEHIPWYKTEETLREWFRITAPGGFVEIWTNDLEELCRRYIKKINFTPKTNEFREKNPENILQLWVNIKLFWHDHLGHQEEWHRAVFDFGLLKHYLTKVGFDVVVRLERHEIRGPDHGCLEFGARAYKALTPDRVKTMLAARRAELRTFRLRRIRRRVRWSLTHAGRFARRAAHDILSRSRRLLVKPRDG